jgi:hypothetical protein
MGANGTDGVLVIDCGECALEGTAACADCVVTWLVDREPGDAVVIDVAEVRALRALEHGGLVPTLRHAPRAAGDRGRC